MDCSPSGSSVHGDSPGKNTGVGCHALLQGIFPMQGSNPGLLHCREILYYLSHQGSPYIYMTHILHGTHMYKNTVVPTDCMQHTSLPCHFSVSQNLLKLMSIESMMPSNHLLLCCPLLLLPSIFPGIRVFSNELTLHQAAKVLELQHWSFQ